MEEERLDLISSIPYDILCRIFSSLPLKEAVRTSILSTDWKSLWTPLELNLSFDSDRISSLEASEEVARAMRVFLSSYDAPELLRICLGPANDEDHEITVSATKGVEKDLHLDFSDRKKLGIEFNLILNSTCVRENGFSALKRLHLRSVTCVSKILVSGLFSNCQVLESLKLEKCSGLRSVEMRANDCLESLMVVDCPNMANITVSATNLKSFWYRGVLPQIQMNETSNLVEVVLDLKDGAGDNEFDCEDVLSSLASIKDVEILTISGWLLEWLCSAGVIFGKLEFQFRKLKELWWIDSSIQKPKRDSLACFLNSTPFLQKLYINIDSRLSSVCPPFFHQYWHEPHLWMDDATVKCNASQLQHLQIIKMVGFVDEDDPLILMDILLKMAIALESMTLTLADDHT